MSETNAVVKHEPISIIRSMDDAERAARAMAASGFFADSKQASQAVVKILAGQELGFGPFASMTGVNIIQSKPVLAANLMAAAVKRQGKYNYRVTRLDDAGCELTFFENGQEVGKSAFGKADAEKAQLLTKDNWKKYPRNMYFARALSNGQKWYAPDVFNGATVYTPDELGAVVDEEGNAIIPAETGIDATGEKVTDQAWDKWLALNNRAEKMNINYPDHGYPRNQWTMTSLRNSYQDLLESVTGAEAQAKDEDPA
jgi:hypothetical protein